jgi:hypothetical protein
MVADAFDTAVGAPPIGSRRWRLRSEVARGVANLRNFRKRRAYGRPEIHRPYTPG